jgi:hypothetical protein
MVSSVDPLTQSAAAGLHAGASGAQAEMAGARLFADMMRGTDPQHGGAHAAVSGVPLAGGHSSAGVTEVMQQMSGLQDPNDPIKAQMVMLDVFGQRMEALGRLHVVMSLGSGVTNVFKQLFNRHD